jgi:hypothetical protein
VAALIKQATGIAPEVVPGARGEFSIWVGEKKVAEKTMRGFPSEPDVVAAVERGVRS